MPGFITLWSHQRCFQTLATSLHQGAATPGGGTAPGPGPGTDITEKVKPPSTSSSYTNPLSIQKFEPSALDKQYLVWSGRYKSKGEIPATLDKEVIERARSWGRIRLNLSFMAVGIIGAFAMVYMGKDSWRKGDSVTGRNLEWHRKVKEEHQLTEKKT